MFFNKIVKCDTHLKLMQYIGAHKPMCKDALIGKYGGCMHIVNRDDIIESLPKDDFLTFFKAICEA
jgi:hypothetical protein